MKSIKNLGIKTKEGFEVRNLKRFPSMEYGEEGGLEADLYLDGKWAGTIYNAGDGGPASFTYANVAFEPEEIAAKGLTFLKRVDPDYGPAGRFAWLRTKTVAKFNDDDLEAVVTTIEERSEVIKQAKKSFKKGYKAVAALKSDWQISYLQYRVEDVTREEVQKWLKDSGNDSKYHEFEILTCSMDLGVL